MTVSNSPRNELPEMNSPELKLPDLDLPNMDLLETPVVSELEISQAQAYMGEVQSSRKLEIGETAKGFVKELISFNPGSPEFAKKIRDIQTLANKDVIASTTGSSRILERSASSLVGAKKEGNTASAEVASTLLDLRAAVSDLTPKANKSFASKVMGLLPGGKKAETYFQRYESAQDQLDQITASLRQGKVSLEEDNADLQKEKYLQWDAMEALNEYILLAEAIDKELVSQIAELKAVGNTSAAKALESDMVFVVRQRTQDLSTQLTVALQGFMAMELIRSNNNELIKGVDRAENTTMTALRISVIVANALGQQARVLDGLDAVDEATNKTISLTGDMLRQQTQRIHERASSSGVSVETLNKAFNDIFSTIDAIDTYKLKANETMKVTLDNLSAQLNRAKPHLDRVKALESSSDELESHLELTSHTNETNNA
jgi:uncharacterized protein YaaN involved in tellurite resistance